MGSVVRDREIARFLIHKGIDQIIEYMMFYEVDLDERRVLRELARMYSCDLKRPDKGTRGNPTLLEKRKSRGREK